MLLGSAGSDTARFGFRSWVRALEESFDVSIEVETIMGPDNRPAGVGGVICRRGLGGPRMAFTVDADETRCALQYVS